MCKSIKYKKFAKFCWTVSSSEHFHTNMSQSHNSNVDTVNHFSIQDLIQYDPQATDSTS